MASTVPNTYHGGRPSRLRDPEFAQRVAECFAVGMTREKMSDLGLGDPKTISGYRRDPRVVTLVRKIMRDRVQDIVSKVDYELNNRLRNADMLTTKELLEMRKEFLGGQLRESATEIDDATINEAQQALEADPDLADEFRALLQRGMQSSRPIKPGE